MKRFPDALKDAFEVGKGPPPGRSKSGGFPSHEGKTTIQGQVELLGDFARHKVGVRDGPKHSGAVLRTEWGRVIVYLGPAWYFCQHNFPIRAGDILEISGTTIFLSGRQPILLAQEVRTKGRKLKIRDEQGRPLWGRR